LSEVSSITLVINSLVIRTPILLDFQAHRVDLFRAFCFFFGALFRAFFKGHFRAVLGCFFRRFLTVQTMIFDDSMMVFKGFYESAIYRL